MTIILAYLAAHLGFLWDEARYRITGSAISTSNGGDAVLIVESDDLRLRFACDRQQPTLELQPTWLPPSSEWYSIDLVRRMQTGQRPASALLDASYAAFIRRDLGQIEARFGRANWADTSATLKALKRERMKDLFG